MLLNVISSLVLAATVSTVLFALHALWLRKFRQCLLWSAGIVVSGAALLLLIESGHEPRRLFVAACVFAVFLWRLRFPDPADRSMARLCRRTQRA